MPSRAGWPDGQVTIDYDAARITTQGSVPIGIGTDNQQDLGTCPLATGRGGNTVDASYLPVPVPWAQFQTQLTDQVEGDATATISGTVTDTTTGSAPASARRI